MKKLLFIALLIFLLAANAYAAAPFTFPGFVVQEDCSTITRGGCIDSDDGTVYTWTGAAVTAVSGAISDTAFNFTTWDGVTTIGGSKNAIRDRFYVYDTDGDGDIDSIDAGLGGGTVTTVEENNVAVDASVASIDFLGADFDVTEDPEDEVNVIIAAAITRDAEWNTFAEVDTAVADKTLVNEEDAATIDQDWTFTTGLVLGATGDVTQTSAAVDWDLFDDDATALSFDAAGKAGILAIDTQDAAEGVTMSGTLGVTGKLNTGADAAEAGAINLSNAAVIAFEDATEATITHVNDTGFVVNLEWEVTGTLDANGVVALGDGGDNFSVASDGIDIDTSGNITNAGTIGCDKITSTAAFESATGLFDVTGAAAMQVGSDNVTVITLKTDDTGDGTDLVVPAQSINGSEMLNNTVTATQIAATVTFADADLVDFSGITQTNDTNEGLILPTWANVTVVGLTSGAMAWDETTDAVKIKADSGWVSFAAVAAPIDAEYLVLDSGGNATLTGEREVTFGAGIGSTDGGADSTLDFYFDGAELDGDTFGNNTTGTWTFDGGGTDVTFAYGDAVATWSHMTVTNLLTANAGIDIGTSQAIVGTTAMTIGDNAQTIAIDSSDWNISATGVADGLGNVTSNGIGEFASLTEGGVAVHNNDQMDASSELRAIVDDETGTGVLVFATAPTFTTSIAFNAVTDTVAGIQNQNLVDKTAAEDISGSAWEWQDGDFVQFGNAADYQISYDETTNDNLIIQTTAVAAAATTTGMVQIKVNDGSGTLTDDQEVLEILNDSTELMSLDENGDLVVAGALTSTASGGDSFITLTTQAATPASAGINSLYYVNNVLKIKENDVEKDVVTPVDSTITWTGTTHDFSAVTNFEIPNSAGLTLDTAGEIGIDTTNHYFMIHIDGATHEFEYDTIADNDVFQYDVTSGRWQANQVTASSVALDDITDPDDDTLTTITFDHKDEAVLFLNSGAMDAGSFFKIEQTSGSATAGVLLEVKAADASVTAAQFGDGTDYMNVSKVGAVTFAGTTSGITPIPPTAGNVDIGSATYEYEDLYLADDGIVYLGDGQDVTITHDPDDGIFLKSIATTDDNPVLLTLQTGETDIAVDDVLGGVYFQAPDETGTDAILVAGGIEVVSEGTFAADNNAAKLSFLTAASEAAAEKMSLSSAGVLTISSDLVITGNDITFGNAETISNTTNGDIDYMATNHDLESPDGTDYLRIATANNGASVISTTSGGTDTITIGDGTDLVTVASGKWDVAADGSMDFADATAAIFTTTAGGFTFDADDPAASAGQDYFSITGTLPIANGSDTYRGLYLNLDTSANHTGTSNSTVLLDMAAPTGDPHANLYGFRLGNLTGSTGAAGEVEYGIQIGTGWDSDIHFADTTAVITSGGTITIEAMTVDAGAVSNVTTLGMTDNLTIAATEPTIFLEDTTSAKTADALIKNVANDNDDAVMTLAVDDSEGDDTSYIELDGANDRVEIKQPALFDFTAEFDGIASFDANPAIWDGTHYLTFDADGLTSAATIKFGGDTNNLLIANGTGGIDIAAGATLDLDKSLTVGTNAGTINFGAASKTLTISETATIDQDIQVSATPEFANLTLANGGTITFTDAGSDTIDHTDDTGIAMVSGSGTVTIESVVFTGGAISSASTLAMGGALTGATTATFSHTDPQILMNDTTAAATGTGIISVDAATANQASQLLFYVDETADDTPVLYMTIDGVTGQISHYKEAYYDNNSAAATFGDVSKDADVVVAFDAVTSQGSITYMEDEDRFDFDNDVDVVGAFTAGTVAADTTITMGGALTGATTIALSSDIILTEQADHASTPGAGYGYLWTKSTAPSTLIFTNDAGTDVTVGAAGAATAWDDIGEPDADKAISFDDDEITSFTFADTDEDMFTVTGSGAFGDVSVMKVTTSGDATDGTVLEVVAADANVDPLVVSASGKANALVVGQNTGVVTIAGVAEGTDALILSLGDITLTDGDLNLTAGDATFGEDVTVTGFLMPNGGVKALTPVSGSTTGFAAGFTGANLYGGTYVVTSDDGDLQLPLMAVGMNFTVITSTAIQVVAATNVNDGYFLDGTDTAEDNSVVNSSTSGDIAVFQYYTADDWLITTNGWTTE